MFRMAEEKEWSRWESNPRPLECHLRLTLLRVSTTVRDCARIQRFPLKLTHRRGPSRTPRPPYFRPTFTPRGRTRPRSPGVARRPGTAHERVSPFAATTRLPGASISPLCFRKRRAARLHESDRAEWFWTTGSVLAAVGHVETAASTPRARSAPATSPARNPAAAASLLRKASMCATARPRAKRGECGPGQRSRTGGGGGESPAGGTRAAHR